MKEGHEHISLESAIVVLREIDYRTPTFILDVHIGCSLYYQYAGNFLCGLWVRCALKVTTGTLGLYCIAGPDGVEKRCAAKGIFGTHTSATLDQKANKLEVFHTHGNVKRCKEVIVRSVDGVSKCVVSSRRSIGWSIWRCRRTFCAFCWFGRGQYVKQELCAFL